MNDISQRDSLTVTVAGETNCRVDRYISEKLGLFTRSQIKNRNVRILLKGTELKLSKKVSSGDVLEIYYSLPSSLEIEPENIPLDILFEDANVIVLNKPQGLVVHPAPGNYTGTMVQGLMYYLKNLSLNFPGEVVRPGIVHRLDKDTSGVIIAAKNYEALEFLARQFREKTTIKKYCAFVKGNVRKSSGVIDTFMARDKKNRKKFAVYELTGKKAVTDFYTVKRGNMATFVILTPHTGRTHQLRVHMNYIGYPIIGDPLYGRKSKTFAESTMMLHASQLNIILPGEQEPERFYAPLPERFTEFIKNDNLFHTLSENYIQEYLLHQD